MGRDPLSGPPRTAATRQLERQLRDAWASGRRVQIMTKPPERACARGIVKHVAPTGTFAIVGRTHVPIDRIARVRDAAPLAARRERAVPRTPQGAVAPPGPQAQLLRSTRHRSA